MTFGELWVSLSAFAAQNGTVPGPTTAPQTVGNGTNTSNIDHQPILGASLPHWVWPYINLLVAALIIVLGYYLSQYVVRLLGRPVARRFGRESVAQTILRSARLGTVLLGVGVAWAYLELGLPNIVLSVTVFSAVLGLVLAPIIGSIISGIFVLADQPFDVGDMIELDDGRRGFVEDMTLRYTKIFTLDNTFIVISNSSIQERDIVNYSAEDERTRLSLPLLVTYECDIEEARSIMERAAQDCDDVLEGGPDIRIGSARYPAKPTCYIDEYANDGVLLTLRFWAQRPYKLLTVRSHVQERIWSMIEDADVEIAYPHQHLVFDDTSGQARVSVSDGSTQDEMIPQESRVRRNMSQDRQGEP